MSRNFRCNCPCHGDQHGNAAGDQYFSCKLCYAANHMGNLPRLSHEAAPKPKGPRKPRPPKPTVTVEAVIKEGAKVAMENIALAAEMAMRSKLGLPGAAGAGAVIGVLVVTLVTSEP